MVETTTLESIANDLAAETKQPEIQTQGDFQSIADDLAPADEVKPETEQKPEVQVEETQTEEVKAEDKEDDLLELVDEADEKPEGEKPEIFNPDDLKEIGVEVKTKSELKEFISSLKNENETLRSKADEVYANEDIKKLNDYVKQGGDLKAYVGEVQQLSAYKQTLESLNGINPVEAYKYSILQQFGVKDVSELPADKQQEFEDYIESKPAFEKELEGKKLINAEKAAYQAEINRIEQGITQAQENLAKKNEAYASNVSKAIQSLTGVDGIKVKDSEKAEMAKLLKNPKQALQEIMPLDKDGLPDVGALVEIVYRAKYGKQNTQLLLTRAKSSGKKEVFEKLTNSREKEITQHSKDAITTDPVAEAIARM